MKKTIDFVNVFPRNDDRKEGFEYKDIYQTVVDYSVDLGFRHTLVTVGDKRIDPWILSQHCLNYNPNFAPIIAVNPFYQHPVNVVKKIISLKSLYSSDIALNLVTGSFFNELKAVNDVMSFSERSERLSEFYKTIIALLEPTDSHFHGKYYQAQAAEIYPKYSFEKFKFFATGTLPIEYKSNIHANFIQSIRPLDQMEKANVPNSGLSIGICVRPTREEALREVERIYPANRRGEMLFLMGLANNETPWNKWIKSYLEGQKAEDPLYFLKPMKNHWTAAIFLVGSYEEVANRIKAYAELEYKFFILDFPPEEAPHIKHFLQYFKAQEL